jgi:hypothetical protein
MEVLTQKKIFLHLEGGLGNQLFQYAAARALTANLGGTLYLDSVTGFSFDQFYRRVFELSRFPIKAQKASSKQRAPFVLFRQLGIRRFSFLQKLFDGRFPYFYLEPAFEYSPFTSGLDSNRYIWMIGYWQSELYFKPYEGIVRVELEPPVPLQTHVCFLGERMREQNSVAVGVRLYEETCDPKAHCRDGRLKTPSEVSAAIERLQSMQEDLHFYIFCTHQAPFISKLRLPNNTKIVTPDMGYSNATDMLWLLSQCRHHVLTNSSLYWWGAWLSSSNHPACNQTIFAADNFINKDSLCSHWLSF